jgi:S-adenosylmethionine:tRNA-ribosyltransferase-isomerase (queuine synthetase)
MNRAPSTGTENEMTILKAVFTSVHLPTSKLGSILSAMDSEEKLKFLYKINIRFVIIFT